MEKYKQKTIKERIEQKRNKLRQYTKEQLISIILKIENMGLII